MEIDDRVYGQRTVDEQVLEELIASDPVQRLQGINQAGPQRYFIDRHRPVTRFEHSLGVMLLLREHGASLQEQIAGLLHDVPHTAFSHVADFVFGDEDHEYHERFMDEIVRGSEIPGILEGHGFDVDYILDEDNFPLLERDLPDLCADRIDYFLRDVTAYQGAGLAHLRDALTTHDGRFVLEDREVAEEYALRYIAADEEIWADPLEMTIWHLFADAVRRALEIGVLDHDDLFLTDDVVFEKIRGTDDDRIRELLDTLDGLEVAVDPDDPDLTVTTKPRYVDPHVLDGDDLVRASDYSNEVRERIADHRDDVADGFPVRILNH